MPLIFIIPMYLYIVRSREFLRCFEVDLDTRASSMRSA